MSSIEISPGSPFETCGFSLPRRPCATCLLKHAMIHWLPETKTPCVHEPTMEENCDKEKKSFILSCTRCCLAAGSRGDVLASAGSKRGGQIHRRSRTVASCHLETLERRQRLRWWLGRWWGGHDPRKLQHRGGQVDVLFVSARLTKLNGHQQGPKQIRKAGRESCGRASGTSCDSPLCDDETH